MEKIKLVNITVLLLFVFQIITNAQVFTRALGENHELKDYIPWYFLDMPDTLTAPPVDVQQVLYQDSIEGNLINRVGIEVALNLDDTDGTVYEFQNFRVWKLLLYSEGAKTISFNLENLVLPEGSGMFIYNPSTKVVVGPIQSHNLHNGNFSSDVIKGDSALIDVFLLEENHGLFSIDVKEIIHGFEMEFDSYDPDFMKSGECNIDVKCPEGIGFENEIAAVCKIINIGTCTGALINNECNNFTPFILSANHCFKTASVATKSKFRFKYESKNCSNPPSILPMEPEPHTWVTFFGGTLRANSPTSCSDFALIELMDAVTASEAAKDLAFAGWNRADVLPNNSTCIHHPLGDVKKISFDDNPAILSSGNPCALELVFDRGIVEDGSSGGPIFDENNLIVGQIRSGEIDCIFTGGTIQAGRLFDSWTGDGT